jgi:pyruvate,water dikinase
VTTVVFTRPMCGEASGEVLDLGGAPGADCAGAKAAALGRARAAGLPVLPGFAISPDAAAYVATRTSGPAMAAVRQAWEEISASGSRSVVVRSSSTVEDGESSSMAGRFTSVLDVRGWDSFLDAVREVVDSGVAVHEGLPLAGRMAVLVQPFVEPTAGGVLFGADPVTGRQDRLVLAAVAGGPDALVSGEVDGIQVSLTPRGKVVDSTGSIPGLDRTAMRALVTLAQRAAEVFGGPQDVEWALIDGDVVMLQSRPITASATHAEAKGPVFGPGPVAETFPAPLSALEQDLWLAPLRDAMREVLRLTGGASRRRIDNSELVITVDGRVAVDLALLGDDSFAPKKSFFAKLDPRPPTRRLKAAWRVGRLRAALPALARDVVEEIDSQLASVPDLTSLSDGELFVVLSRAHQALVSVHGHEMLAGQLLSTEDTPVTAAGNALRVLAQYHDENATAEELIARHPVLLALVPPALGVSPVLPPAPRVFATTPEVDADVLLREALRLRARWLQELTGRVAMELGHRLAQRGEIMDATVVRDLSLDELRMLAEGRLVIAEVNAAPVDTNPLPARFRLSDTGVAVPVQSKRGKDEGGRGAGGGRRRGVVQPADMLPAEGAVLVVRTLDPGLAPMLPGLAGLVAETGSVLSHLAILARELQIPTVVGVEDAVRRFPPGARVVVDGTTGEVAVEDAEEVRA